MVRVIGLAALLGAAALFGACEKKGEAIVAVPAPPSTMRVALTTLDPFIPMDSAAMALDASIRQFVADNPTVSLNRELSTPGAVSAKLSELAAADTLPDLFVLRPDQAAEFAAAGHLLALDDLFARDPAFAALFGEGAPPAYAIPYDEAGAWLIALKAGLFPAQRDAAWALAKAYVASR
jgi:ABC-type glycerol-3-phosphate transport system substrate-binding protein